MESQARGAREWRRIEPFLAGVALLALLVGVFFVLRPFVTALMWAIVLSYALFPLQRRFTVWLRGSRTLAACLVTLSLTLLLAGPIVLIGLSLAEDAKSLGQATRQWVLEAPETPPPWVGGMPFVGGELESYWGTLVEGRRTWLDQIDTKVERFAANESLVVPSAQDGQPFRDRPGAAAEDPDAPRLVALAGRTIAGARNWLLAAGLAIGNGVIQVLLSGFLTFFLLRDADFLAQRLRVVVDRLAGGARGRHLIQTAGETVNSVVYGILGTAFVQALLGGIGFAIAGVPGAVLLGVLTFFVAIIPFGPPVVWVPAALWLFFQGSPGWAVFVLVWGAVCISGVDNLLRPFLISQGTNLPFVLIFCGVIGGALAFGLIGVFLGPTLLAVAYRLLEEWSSMPPAMVED
jgi:predicted PurR-regulated permease PerM